MSDDDRPKVENKVYSKMPGGKVADTKYAQRYVNDPAEIEDIRKRGYSMPKEGGKTSKYWTAVDEPNTSYPENRQLLRIERSKLAADRAARAADIELHDPKTNTWNSLGGGRTSVAPSGGALLREMNPQKLYAKGGKVSSASKRGDGIAQRGKTKGRMV